MSSCISFTIVSVLCIKKNFYLLNDFYELKRKMIVPVNYLVTLKSESRLHFSSSADYAILELWGGGA